MPKVYYNPITKQNEWSYTKEEKEQMLKELKNKPTKKLPSEVVISKKIVGISHIGNRHIPFNPHCKDDQDVFDWGDRNEN